MLSSDLTNKVGFPTVVHGDSDRVITAYGQSYTATADCWLNISCKATGSKNLQLFVDGIVLTQLSPGDSYSATIPIKAGTVVAARNDADSGTYLVYKLPIQ